MDFDSALEKEIADNDGDISKVYTRLQEEFSHKYNHLFKLFQEEKLLRETLAFYKRRNNALLDILAEAEPTKNVLDEELILRVKNLVEMNPQLDALLEIQNLESLSKSTNVKLNLLLEESIAELPVDDTIHVEKNPEDIELWLRRNQPNLVSSKFQPIYYKDHKIHGVEDDSSVKKRKKTGN